MPAKSTIVNFGRNVAFTPTEYYEPANEEAVLEILRSAKQRRIRVVGSLHSWSRAAAGDQIVISLRRLNQVEVVQRNGEPFAIVGGGCQIKHLLKELKRHGDLTLPSLGLITEQTIAGATATGTHGSGKHSLSHYVAEVRVANFDSDGSVRIETVTEGVELLAARCALGCMGVILTVGMRCRERYLIAEKWRWHEELESVVDSESEEPLQQFFLVPWKWKYLAQHRREAAERRSLLALLYRFYCFVVFDITLHVCLVFLTRYMRSRRASKAFLRSIAPLCVVTNWRVVDDSERILVMEHELFRHIEIEMFVRRSYLDSALGLTEAMLKHFDGDPSALSEHQEMIREVGLWEVVSNAAGNYTHAYPVCVRRVMPDETLISMAADSDEDVYAISFISYVSPSDRTAFHEFARLICATMVRLYEARPHWGKVCPISAKEADQLYDRLGEFRSVAKAADRRAQFRNAWIDETLFVEGKGSG